MKAIQKNILLLSIVAVFALVFVSGMASAANVFFDQVTGDSQTINPKDTAQITFVINNQFSDNVTSMVLTLPNVNSIGIWSSVTLGSKQYSIGNDNTVTFSNVKILPNTVSDKFVLVFQSNANAPVGTLNGALHMAAKYEGSGNSIIIPDQSISLSINSAPALTITEIQSLTTSQAAMVNVTNTGNVAFTNVQMKLSGDLTGIATPTSFSLDVGKSMTVNVNATNLKDLQFGNHQLSIFAEGTATNVDVNSSSLSWTLGKTFCRSGEQGKNLTITRVKVSNEGEGTTSTWKLLDTVNVEVKVSNDGDKDVRDVFLKMGLFDSSGRNKVADLTFTGSDNEEVSIGTLGNGNTETVTYSFKIPADISTGSYRLAMKAYSDDVKEDKECTSTSDDMSDRTFESISIDSEDKKGKYISFENTQVPSVVQCGEKTTLQTDVFNVGNSRQDRVKVTLYNKELGINQEYEIKKQMDTGDKTTGVQFEFDVPQSAKNATYQLQLSAHYGYRSSGYNEELDSPVNVPLKIVCAINGGGNTQSGSAAISASLPSSPKAGQDFSVNVKVTNTQNTAGEFIVDVRNYDTWATLTDVSDRVLELQPGESKDVTLKFKANNDASGDKTFTMSVLSNGETSQKDVSVNVASTAPTGGFNFGDNTFLWIIGAINVVLIILIIIVAVRVSSRR